MGRRYYDSKVTVEESLDVSVFKLRRWGMLNSNVNGILRWVNNRSGKKSSIGVIVQITDDPHVRFVYKITDRHGKQTDYAQEVSLTKTRCNLGGYRYWFVCPCCYKRVGVLYFAPGDVHFRCRLCNNLTYYSRNESNPYAILGETDRKMKKLQSQIKRWTWRGRPTRKVRQLRCLQHKMNALSPQLMVRLRRLDGRIENQQKRAKA